MHTNSEDLPLVPGPFMILVKKIQWEKLSHKWNTNFLWNKKNSQPVSQKVHFGKFLFCSGWKLLKVIKLGANVH